MNFLLRIVITAVVAFGLSYILRGIHIDSFITALVLVITILSFGLFLFVINAIIVLLAGKFVDGFRVDGFERKQEER